MSEGAKWIKVCCDIFDDDKFLIIEGEHEDKADVIEVIWFKLLTLAGKSGNAGIFTMSDGRPYSDKMLANIIRRPVEDVKLALKTFIEFGMVENVNGIYTISNWTKHQSMDAYEKKKERDRIYQQARRDSRRATVEENAKIVDKKQESSDESSDTHRRIVKKSSYSLSINNIVSYLNNRLGTRYKSTSSKTQGLINARLNEGFTEEDFFTVIESKYNEWFGTDMEKYLRPETLFGTKFENYLNTAPKDTGFDVEWGFNQFFDRYPIKNGYNGGLSAYREYIAKKEDPMSASKSLLMAMADYLDDCAKSNPDEPTRYVKSLERWIREDADGWVRMLGE